MSTADKAYDLAARMDRHVTTHIKSSDIPSLPALGDYATYTAMTGWTETGSLANGWGKGSGYFKYRRFFTNMWLIAAKDLNCASGTKTNDTTILTTANAGWSAPATNHILPAFCDAARTGTYGLEVPSLTFVNDGSVRCLGVAGGAQTLSCYGWLFIDI